MKTPHPSPDPLLRSLTEEAANLPSLAAAEARQRSIQRRRNQRNSLVAITSLIGIVSWWVSYPVSESPHGPADSHKIAETHFEDPAELQALPSGLSPEQAAVVKAAGDLPLLLIRDSSGKVSRIHVINR